MAVNNRSVQMQVNFHFDDDTSTTIDGDAEHGVVVVHIREDVKNGVKLFVHTLDEIDRLDDAVQSARAAMVAIVDARVQQALALVDEGLPIDCPQRVRQNAHDDVEADVRGGDLVLVSVKRALETAWSTPVVLDPGCSAVGVAS